MRDVAAINDAIRNDYEDAKRYRENPRVVRVLEHLLRLTNSDEQNDEMDKATAAREIPAPACKHAHVSGTSGNCEDCGKKIFSPAAA